MRIKTALPLTLSTIAKTLGITIDFDREINAVATHSALCEKGDLFIALRGENFDGSAFIDEARKKGAFVLSESEQADFRVNCAHKALLDIACAYKEIIAPKYIVAITGSVGKTTVKDFTYTLLSSQMTAHKTYGNYNNIIGVSYTLLSAPKNADALVCELGMNHIGEIDVISRAIKPDISVITNIGTAHIGNLGSREKIAQAKLEIQNGMKSGRTVILKDEPLLSGARTPYTISYTDENADLFARILSKNQSGSEIFVKTKNFQNVFATKLFSSHTVNSLLIAIAVCDILSINADAIFKAAENIKPDTLRQKFIYSNGYKIFDDSYNSSPEAVIADLKMLREITEEASAIIGDMLELGEKSQMLHRYIGGECARQSIKKLYAFGEYANDIAFGAIEAGMDKRCIFINNDVSFPELTAQQISESYAGETLLVKASHSLNAYRIIEILTNERN